MRKKSLLGIVLGLLISVQGYACDQTERPASLKTTNFDLDQKSATGITEEEFNSFQTELKNYIHQSFGATLNVDRNWENGTVNAYARQTGSTWQISMFGGLARHETITADARTSSMSRARTPLVERQKNHGMALVGHLTKVNLTTGVR